MRLLRPLGLLALAATTAAQTLPYNPTRIFKAQNLSFAYIFSALEDAATSEFFTVDLREPFSNSNLVTGVVSSTLPFQNNDPAIAFTPTMDTSGNITVVAGKCSEGANGVQMWRFQPDVKQGKNEKFIGKGQWTQYPLSGNPTTDPMAGANFLANGISFTGSQDDGSLNATTYIFGGMCPYSNSSDVDWTSAANYSNQMLVADPSTANNGATEYAMSIATTNGPPIAEAGFSITALPSSSSVGSGGSTSRVQQDFVLLGGHTQVAFINMSQVALFSLPQQSWTFLPVNQPTPAKTDLAVRDNTVSEVEPRSGHTAVLSEDGSTIIVFGGWVGDASNPAQPQLAILETSDGYGGDWTWTVPKISGPGLDSGSGIFGHGATLLDGNIMMVFGGYSISAPSASPSKRDITNRGRQLMLFNVTSRTWIDEWTPLSSDTSNPTGASHGSLSKSSQKAGLGAGLAVGFILLIALIVFYFWYTRRLKQSRQDRERRALTHSSDGSSIGQIGQPFIEKGGVDGRGGDMSAVGGFWQGQRNAAQRAYPWDPSGREGTQARPKEADSTGAFVDIPSPTRGLRKGLNSRPYLYHPAPRFEEKRLSGSGQIHTIAERDDEDATSMRASRSSRERSEAERQLAEVERALRPNRPLSDPFADPPNPLGSHPVSPELGETARRLPTEVHMGSPPPRSSHGKLETAGIWVSEPLQQPLLYGSDGRSSPSKSHSDERTSSTLSDRSHLSTVSSNSITRTMSTRTGALLAAAAAAMTNRGYSVPPTAEERTLTMSTDGSQRSPYRIDTRARSSTANSGPLPSAGTDADSFVTAKSGFGQLQSEGEALLGGRPAMGRDDPYGRAMATFNGNKPNSVAPSDPVYGVPQAIPNRRRQGLMGSLRRAIVAIAPTPRSMSLNANSEQQYADMQSTASSSPIKERRNPLNTPRRAVSDGGALLRQKRGAKDWEEENKWPPYRDDPNAGDWGEQGRTSIDKQQAEEDWDVEDAAQKRDFQVMFTVPKTRLRVVNADVDRASLRSASDSALSRSESLRRQGSVRSLKPATRGGGGAAEQHEKSLLPLTVEEGDDVFKTKAA